MDGIRVVDAATIYAGPMIATLLGDFGADVIKIEHPRGDGIRRWEWRKNGESLWWALTGRNKRAVGLSISDARGADVLRRLLTTADVFIENFRPGTLERWNLAPEDLLKLNPRLVIVRVSGFGQTGPYSSRPGFGTIAEAMSGFAHTNGHEDGPPVLPQWPLADGVTALAGAFATMVALRHAQETGEGQVVDLSIYEPLMWILGAQASAFDQLGANPKRQGSRTDFNVPRECFRARDDRYIALSGATTETAARIMRAVGRADIADAPWFTDIAGRVDHRREIDDAIAAWIGARESAEVLETFGALNITAGPVYSVADIMTDPHFSERGTIVSVDHPVLGAMKMQGLIANLTKTPGRIDSVGAPTGASTRSILTSELGYADEHVTELVSDGIAVEAEQIQPEREHCDCAASTSGHECSPLPSISTHP